MVAVNGWYPVVFIGGPRDGGVDDIAVLKATIPHTSAGQPGLYQLTTTTRDGRHVYEWAGVLA